MLRQSLLKAAQAVYGVSSYAVMSLSCFETFSGSRCKLKLEFRRATFVLVGVVSTDAVNPRDALVRAHHSAHLLYPVHYILPCLRLSSLFPVVLSVPVVLRLV